jgi:hypothetical protein
MQNEKDMDAGRPSGLSSCGSSQQAVSPVPASIPDAWRCFHCDAVFDNRRDAEAHFGRTEDSKPACLIKAGAEGSLVRALRRAENELAEAWWMIHQESTEAARAYCAQQIRHREQLMAAEEAGYERGLSDARQEFLTNAQAIEARRAETGTGSVHESAVGNADASNSGREDSHAG